MRQDLKRLAGRVAKLEARTSEAEEELPDWCREGTQGFLLLISNCRELAKRICAIEIPGGFDGDEFPESVHERVNKMGVDMLNSGGHGEAALVARAELARWPNTWRYRPKGTEPTVDAGVSANHT